MALMDTTLVFAKADIEAPMEGIFHTPVLPNGLSELDGITGQRGQKHARLDRDLLAYFAVRLDQAHPGDSGPRALPPQHSIADVIQ